MPFDPVPVQRIATADEFWAATDEQAFRMLACALRHLPADHAWDYSKVYRSSKPEHKGHCGSAGCAMGLADALWASEAVIQSASLRLELHDHLKTGGIFYDVGTYNNKYMQDVTPEEVADAIDRYLLTGDPRP